MTNDFIWYDVMIPDTDAGRAFYRAVFGWDMKDSGVPGHDYTLLSAGETMVGGLMPLTPETAAMGVPPCWTGYIHVADVDAMVARLTAAGGALRRPAEDIPGVGRLAVVADPHDAVFILFKPNGEAPPAPPPPADAPGHFGWRELMAGDGDKAFDFYAALFGWTKAEAIDMGPMGIYQLFAIDGTTRGGMMTKPPQCPVPCWQYYINAEAIDAAVERVTTGGGKVVNGPMQVPTGSWIAQCVDPQGAFFGMVAPVR
jgi:predicted enzyme related to lactoylglutathione lyase